MLRMWMRHDIGGVPLHVVMGVYLILCEGTQYAKIGYASNVDERVGQLQTGCPLQLTIKAWNPMSSFDDERRLHHMYAHRLHAREWYAYEDSMVLAIQQCSTPISRAPRLTKRQKRKLYIESLASQ